MDTTSKEEDVAVLPFQEEQFKVYVGRVPTKFTPEIVKRILVEKLGDDQIKVELIYPHEEEDNNTGEHRGFGFASFQNAQAQNAALELKTIKGGRKPTSKRLHTLYLRPYVPKADEEMTRGREICHLWSLHRCPYGEKCKFQHVGDGGCLLVPNMSPEEEKLWNRKRKGKCFVFKKKGSCPKGDDCPFSHDFEPDSAKATSDSCPVVVIPKSQKDCINWKTKGKCRKGDQCEYRHDPDVQKKALAKKMKKRLREEGSQETNKKARKEKQPLSVRVFGLNYSTTEAELKEFIESTAGHPVKSMVFPRFEDSGRSKGYCGVYFASPKAAKDAVANCDGAELHGRWLRVQTGKSMTIDEWEGLHRSQQ